MKLTSDVKQRKQRNQHNSPNPNNSYKTKKKFTGSYTEGNPNLINKQHTPFAALFQIIVLLKNGKKTNENRVMY